ncbi:MAG: peptide deformylase [Candidatus Shikimatogenerans bostrichidophilus]|nr:MAG: peptide deformylase [Candidatus Shikimatogenerans bostrichidophilus]
MILPILLYNKKNRTILRKISKNIPRHTNLLKLINNMFKTMYYYNGIGLAAPQIGININLFVISIRNEKKIFINPSIINYSKSKIISEEGCLSLPNVYIKIQRYKYILIKTYNIYWEIEFLKLSNMLSIIFQHEFDHLKGKLIIDYIKNN